MRSDGSQIFGKIDGLQRSALLKGVIANGLKVVTQRKRCKVIAVRKGIFSHRHYRAIDGKSYQAGALIKGTWADGSNVLGNDDVVQHRAIIKGLLADRLNILT